MSCPSAQSRVGDAQSQASSPRTLSILSHRLQVLLLIAFNVRASHFQKKEICARSERSPSLFTMLW